MTSASAAGKTVFQNGTRYDVAVIGAGFGGLGAAVDLARRGARVALCEALAYPGGCASTFRRKGFAFEAGATLFSGFAADQLFGRWIRDLSLPVTIDFLDPVVELRTPSFRLPVPLDRDALLDRFARLEGAPIERLCAFFAYQRRVADVLWQLFDDPELLPPFDAAALARHARRSPRYLALVPLIGRPLAAVLARHDLEGFTPLRVYLDALCQITVQCSSAEAESTFALAAMDYYWRGTGHVRGGIGVLARALTDAVGALGGDVFLANAVKAIHTENEGFRVITRRGELFARSVVANVLPHGLRRLLGAEEGAIPHLDRLAARVEEGWGAAMLYLVVEPPEGADESAHHLEIVVDEGAPFLEGNHVFVSISGARDPGRAPAGMRTMTCSSHVPMKKLRALAPAEQAAYIASIQARMRAALDAHAPEWTARVRHAETASPRTFERFTGRFWGHVGGVPRRAGLGAYAGLGPTPVRRGLYLAGDSVFPGQSTLATAVGGVRVAERIARDLGDFTAGTGR
jgi:phytoene dehydrogenase-like protein